MNTKNISLKLSFYGSSTDVGNQNLTLAVSGNYNSAFSETHFLDYTNEEILINITTLQEGTGNINITLSDTQGNIINKNIEITVTPYTPQFYMVEDIEGSDYNFELNADGYYESKNKSISSSYAICKVKFISMTGNLIFDCINFAESSYDFGLLSKLDTPLELSSNTDNSSNIYHSFSGKQSASIQTVTYTGLDDNEHFIYIKYKKDSSVDNNNDSLQFKVRFE